MFSRVLILSRGLCNFRLRRPTPNSFVEQSWPVDGSLCRCLWLLYTHVFISRRKPPPPFDSEVQSRYELRVNKDMTWRLYCHGTQLRLVTSSLVPVSLQWTGWRRGNKIRGTDVVPARMFVKRKYFLH